MDAIVMAAGEGTRLRPLTERWPKPVLPIDGRPVIATLLRELAAAGCLHAVVVTGHLAEQVEELLGDGSPYGVAVRYARQPGVLGSADAVRRGIDAGAAAPFLVTAADTLYAPGDVGRFVSSFAASGADGAIAVRRQPRDQERQPVRIVDGRVVRLIDDDASNPLSAAPLWAFGPTLVPFLSGLSGPPFEFAGAFGGAIEAGLHVAAVEIRPTRDLTHPIDLVEENFPYLER
jgi:NDP-sugar pyrophosphorylase family protein